MDNKQKLVVVLGMHRSGTSAVTRGLTVLGVSLGASLLHSQSDNVKGFWEDSDIKILNQDMLRHLARDWHSLSLLPEPERLIEQLSPFYWRAADLLANKVQEVDAFGFKDPRTCLLIPFWKHVFSQADLDVKYVVVTRHPLSIARSLQARNHFSPEKSLYLWLEYMLSAVTAILDDVAVVVDYDFLMDRPESELIRVAEHLGLGAPEAEALNVYSNDYLDVRLRHTHYTNSDLEKVNILTGDMVIASEAFRKLAMDQWRLDSASVREVFFSLRSGLLARRDLLSYLDRCELQLSDRERRLADFETAIKRRDEKVSACEQRIADFETAIKRRDEKVSACEQRITDFETAIKRRDEKVSAYERRVADFETAIKRRDEKIGALASGDKEKSRHLQQAESAVKETLRENNRLDKALAQQSLKLTGVLGSLQQREGQLRSLEGALKRHEKTIRALNEDKKLSQSSVRQLKGQLAKANEQLQLQQTLLATRAQEQEQEQQARDKVLQQEVSRLEVEVDMLRQSFGWLAEQRLRQWTRQSGQWLKRKGAAYEPEPCEAADHPEPSALPLVVVPEPVATLAPEMALVQASGLFDADWYLAHNPDVMQAGVDPLQHYFHFGAEERRDPHPLFASGWYLKSYPDIARAGANPLVHYLRLGFREGREPHPFFSGRDYMQRYSGVALGDLSPLQHYVQVGWQAGYEAHVLFDRGQYLSEYPELEGQAGYTAFAHCLKRFMAHRKKPLAPLAADRSVHAAFDREQESRFIERIRHRQKMRQGDAGAPLVSIVMATRNRCAEIGSAIESILAQTWQHWELLIVDDGSDDGTFEFVRQTYPDVRVRIESIPPSGVSQARNVGLAKAGGEWIAYLDSDNRWVPCFLEIMLAYVEQQGVDFAYSAIRLLQDKGVAYRHHAFVPGDLLFKNFIDLNSIFHHRRFYDSLGGFDPDLPRTVDWDLIIRYTRQATQVAYVPFVGADYDDRQSTSRITTNEFNAWRFVVTNKHAIDWQAAQQAPLAVGLVSVIVPVFGSVAEMTRCLEALLAARQAVSGGYEILLVDNGSSQEMMDLLAFAATAHVAVRHVICPGSQTLALGWNLGASQTAAEYLVFLQPAAEVMAGWLSPLLAALAQAGTVAVQPRVLAEDGLVRHCGMVFSEKALPAYPLYTGMRAYAACVNQSFSLQALAGGCVLLRRGDFFRQGGFHALYINGWETEDLTLRMTREEGNCCRYVPEATVILHEPVRQSGAEHQAQNRRVFAQCWQGQVPADDLVRYQADGFRVTGWVTDELEPATLAQWQPLLQQQPLVSGWQAQREKPLIAIKVPCPNDREKAEWGDYHFACSLGAALRRLGYGVRIDLRDQWVMRSQTPANEVNLLLRGRGELPLRNDQLNLMWMISHPDRATLDEVARYDHVFVASSLYAGHLQALLGEAGREKISCLLQCTDPAIFYPGECEAAVAHEVLFVGNSRNQYRDAVRLALEAGLKPAVYGTRWQQFIPETLIRGDNVPNGELGRYYRSAQVVLNDHWPEMREKGFISNRIFDVLACGGRLVSDAVVGLPPELESGITVFASDTVEAFRDAVLSASGPDAHTRSRHQQRYRRALEVHEAHSFDARAARIVALIEMLLTKQR